MVLRTIFFNLKESGFALNMLAVFRTNTIQVEIFDEILDINPGTLVSD